MLILTTEKKLRSRRLLAMLPEGDTWEKNIWSNEFRNDTWGAVMDRNPGEPWTHMKALYGRHPGETLIITGSGPSLIPALPLLGKTKHPLMSINRSIKAVPARYFVAHDPDVVVELKEHPNFQAAERIVSCQALEFAKGTAFFGIEAMTQPTRWPSDRRPLYWNEITLGWAIHLAIRMGFDRIVTVGIDLSTGYPDGFIQPGRDKDWLYAQHLGARERTLEMFQKDKAEWYERPIEILDASGGAMPVPKVRLEDVL